MVRVDDSNLESHEEDAPPPPPPPPPPTTSSNHVRLTGSGLPGGEQQQGTSTEIAVATADNNRPTGQLALPSSSSMTTSLATTSNNQYTIPLDENEHKYVGLVNQAMTCYLNSLVQSLYMTPEFRNAMYEWEYVQSAQAKEQKKKAEQSIPCQLQKLFLLLQTTENDSLETKDLTQSFGWTSNEAYDQHDVQELCRLMFDALEHKWKGTKHEKLIQDLYRGTMEDFVACLKCGRESIKTDYFLDLPLAVKPFGAMHAYRSVEEALDAFIQPELLEGSNQYMCETCKSKQDAHKGLRITQFPYLLTIQLKRFDFDYNTMHRIKLNDRMTFPDVLDLNEYVNKKDAAGKPIDQHKNEDDDMDLGSPNPKRYTPSTTSPNRYGSATGTTTTGGDEVCVGQPIDHDVVEALRKSHGDNVYELFSVMVHSGNAAGGHYFAYIKNMDQDKWYVFNDTRVDHASPGDIEKSFGGHTSGWNQSNTNAYMLMYRKIDRKRNASFILSNKLPQHIKDSQEKWKRLEREAEEERLRKLSLIQVHVTINYPFPSVAFLPDRTEYDLTSKKHQIAEDFSEYKTEISREQPIRAIFNQAFDFFLERAQTFNLPFVKGSARLIYVEHGKLLGVFHSPNELDKKLRVVFNHHNGEPGSMFSVHFMLDVRLASTFFPLEIQNQMTIRIQRVDVGKRTTANELTMAVRGDEKMLRVKQWIGSQFRDDIHSLLNSRVILETASSSREFVMIDTSYHTMDFRNVMTQFVGYSTPTLYYDGGLETMVSKESREATLADRKLPFEKSAMFQILDRKCFSTVVKVRLPSQDEIDKARSTSTAFQGPSWKETVAMMCEEDKQWTEPREVNLEIASQRSKTPPEEPADDEAVIPSGRGSTASMRSVSMDDIDSGVSGSLCNNTPQMSPCVSEGDDCCDDQQQLVGKSQLMADYMQKTTPEFFYNRDPPKNLRVALNEDSISVSESETLVASTSSSHPISLRRPEDPIDGRIVSIQSHDGYHKLDVDSRMHLIEFKMWVADQLKMDKDQFVIVKHSTDDGSDTGYETNLQDDVTVSNAFQSCFISIKLRAPLKHDEKMMQIVLFEMHELQKDNWKPLFELPVSQSTLVGDVLLQCLRMYKEVYGDDLPLKMVRLREVFSSGIGTGRSLLNLNTPLDKRGYNWNSPMYLQILGDETIIGKPGDAVMVRRFRPTTVEIGPVQEVLFDAQAENPVLSFLEAVSRLSGIPVERVAVIEPKEYNWSKWPYLKSRLEMLESRSLFTTNLHLSYPHPADFLDKYGSKVLTYKDSEEEAKVLTEDERKQIKIKENNGQSANANRRKERPLRIQMSSVCEG